MMRTLLALALLAAPVSASAQSLFSARGLGVPIDPLDGRARALGGIGVGLPGLNPSLVNPAEIGIGRRGVTAVLQPSAHSLDTGSATGDVSASRFPMFGILYPATPRLTIGIGYAGYLEQSWAVRSRDSVDVAGERVAVEDVVSSTGGLGQIRLAAAYALSPGLALGVAGGVLTGNLDRRAERTFADTTFTLRPFSTRLRWEYSGFFGGLGARWDPTPALRLGVSAMMTSALSADSAEGSAASRDYDAAFQLAAGASGRITDDLVLALGAVRNRYPGLSGGTDAGRDTWTVGGGFEYEGLRTGRRTFPIRLGARLQQLPYYGSGEEPGRELAGMLGVGFRLAGDESGPLAVVDLGVERATRSGLQGSALSDGLDERLWRWTFSLALFGR
jgi:hypothetical protein